ncbi:TPA: hypothetical protein DCP77_01275 [Candidatus Collierbacteria bacterium]|uniref:asparagine synthase (glutamine-hydrolyzing) n=1 Tax=Candidatus Collierbacteria bacterium GW2011_GWA2_42_17 TaxID=1618378 RepID=A0A0G1C049_9BACT|nr:MAG: hypothetical protein UU94_C0003G0023 [Candidatus Collierbacteria bacterium GW2011_GWB2_42_12]KKS43038.1 MAG: hypothetical protein UV06_C0003G0039 [Candidatus Collierbacteria bacterium GW2011_GWA2_42_17]KKS62438.1 MAG: hypothetical protein UV30_C0016G0009 [Candidatus Collierbacteria bacterium GW2011_GWF1_42_50]KKS62920.1 MAG: hypothetical protein UV28_C0003G0018 [Candidatus Collierbacteria bacterium GW2011_GWE2_42_48]KKS63467.1 MAG: hypothetical protein UV29_C0001G0024 [Candidatus Collie
MVFPKITIKKIAGGLGLEVVWPERELPEKVVYEDDDYKAWGYQVDYDGVSFEEKVKLMIAGKEKEIVLIDGDLLMVLWNKKKNEVKAMVGMSGMFPLYFAREGDVFYLSPDFYEVFKEIKKPKINKDEVLDYLLQEYFIYQTDKTFIDGVSRLPAGCLLTITSDLKYQAEELVDLKEIIANPGKDLSAVEATKEIENTLTTAIKKRLEYFKDKPLVCDFSSGFDCMMVGYLMKNLGADFTGYSWYTKENNDDSDPSIVAKWSEVNGVNCKFSDVTNILFFHDEADLKWNATHFFPAWHSLSLALANEKDKVKLFGKNVVTFTGEGGDEFLHASDLLGYLNDINKNEHEFIKEYAEGGAESIYTKTAYDRLVSEDRANSTKFYGNRYGSAVGEQCYFAIYWETGTWMSNPYDTLPMLKLSQRLPKDERGNTINKQKIYFGNTKAFIPEQYRVKLPYHEQVYRFLDEKKDILINILENSVLGKLGIVQSEELLKALREGSIKGVVKEHYLCFGNLCRLEVFLQANGVRG